MSQAETHLELRPLLFSIAYRMIGSVSEAEDIVQEAFLRFEQARRSGAEIESPKAYLTTIATRLSIDHLRSARVQREQYVGPWMPEPLLVDPAPDVSERAEIADSLSMAFLVILESLAPVERAVFLLREVFDYDYPEIARIVRKSEANCRQIVVRARRHVEERKPRFEASRAQREAIAAQFFTAFEQGDPQGLVELLAGDVVFFGDGGGKTVAIPKPLHGRERVGQVLAAFAAQGLTMGVRPEPVIVNGEPGALFRTPDGRLINVVSLDIVDGAIQTVRSIVNPDKLGHLGELANVRELLRSAVKARDGVDPDEQS